MKEFLEEMLGNPSGINEFLNLKYLSSKGEEHYFSVTFDESSMNPRGFVQGGMITAALDQASFLGQCRKPHQKPFSRSGGVAG